MEPTETVLFKSDARRTDDVVLKVGCDQALSAKDSGRGRHQEARNAERPRHLARVQGAGTTEG